MEAAKDTARAHPDFCELIARDQGGWLTHALRAFSVLSAVCWWGAVACPEKATDFWMSTFLLPFLFLYNC